MGGNNNVFGKQLNKKDNFFKTIVKRLKKFEVYSKNDVLSMLGGTKRIIIIFNLLKKKLIYNNLWNFFLKFLAFCKF